MAGGAGDLSFARMLVQYRRSVGLTQEMLADRAKISTRAISDMERGLVRHPQRRTLSALVDALELAEPARSEFLRVVRHRDREPPEPAEPSAQGRVPRELPPDVADLVGRESELAELLALLDGTPRAGYRTATLVSVFGAPGVGKTTFAVHAMHRLAHRYPDGCLFVNLGGDGAEPASEEALGSVLIALGLPEQQLPTDVEARSSLCRAMLRGRKMALLLDNAIDEAQVRPVLPSSPDCLVLVTSRRSLSGLESVARIPLDVLRPDDSVGLLAAIIGHGRADAEPDAVARVAELCGNLPLALRIAGNRLATRPRWRVDALVSRLDDERRRLNVLTAGDLEVRSAFEVSYRQCGAETRSVFRWLSLVGGHEVTVDAVAALCAVDQDLVEHRLEELVDASMLEAATAVGRYVQHDLMRVFAGERLALEESQETINAVRDRLSAWVLSVATHSALLLAPPGCLPDDAPPPYPPVATRAEAIAWLDTEKPLWLDALRHEARAGRHERALAFCSAGRSYAAIRVDEALWCEVFGHGVVAARALELPEQEAAQLNFFGAALSSVRGRHDEALRAHESAWRAARQADNRNAAAWALYHCGRVELMLGKHVEAAGRIRAALAEFCDLGEVHGQQMSLSLLGMALHQLGRFNEAITVHHTVVNYYRSPKMSQYRSRLAVSLLRLADASEAAGDISGAATAYREAGSLAAEDGYAIVEGLAAFGCGRCQEVLGDAVLAREQLERALEVFSEIGESWQRARVANRLAALEPAWLDALA